jgi:protein SCO1/2
MKRAVILALVAACSGRAAAPEHTINNTEVAAPATPVEQPPAPGPSIYDLPVALVTSRGDHVGLDVQRGKPVLVAMFYASCSIACPLLVSEVGQVLAELPDNVRADTQVLLVSFDPARDTPAKLADVVRERRLDEHWTVAAASDADARALAAVLGVKYRRLANGDFAHGSTIVALDGEGREIARTDSLGNRDPLVRALIAYH